MINKPAVSEIIHSTFIKEGIKTEQELIKAGFGPILSDSVDIDEKWAEKLSQELGRTVQFWLNLDKGTRRPPMGPVAPGGER